MAAMSSSSKPAECDLLAQLAAAGLRVRRKGDKLVAFPASAITPLTADLLRQNKALLMPVIEPWIDPELEQLIQQVGAYWGFSAEDTKAAIENAVEKPDGAHAFWEREWASIRGCERGPGSQPPAPIQFLPGIADVPNAQSGFECGKCRHIKMSHERDPNGRRCFWWTCAVGHRILRAGYGLENVLIAAPECTDYDDRALTDLRHCSGTSMHSHRRST